MAKSFNQKVKLLFLMDLFLKKTDAEHAISMKSILEEMEKKDIKAARKSIYSDIETLKDYGLDIEYRKVRPEGYYLASRTFELPELKLLVDAVQSSKFITEKKSRALIKKIEGLTSKHEATQLQRQVYVADRVKTMNESIYYNVDKIHSAISQNVQIGFQYSRWVKDQKVQLKNNGKSYKISPWILSWTDENYYLIGYDSEQKILKHFRVDKMTNITIRDEKRCGKECFEGADPARYSSKTFGMFAGKEETLTIRFPKYYLGIFVDRFGKDVPVRIEDEEYYTTRICVAISEQFFGWLTGLGRGVTIVSPKETAREYQKFLEGIISSYR
ncbi:MAG: helix-turn-helix transcriptional regulator [Dorea sp.]